MRITDRIVFESSNRTLSLLRERSAKAAQEVTSGARVQHPGDDPTVAGSIVTARANETRMKAIASGLKQVASELLQADSALATVSTAMARAQQLALQLSNANYSPSDRQAAAAEVEALTANVVTALNTRVGDRYIFGGFKDDAPPFDSTGAYLGDAGVRRVEIAPGVLQSASIRADQAFKGVGGGVDIFQVLGDLRTALESGDPTAVHATIDSLKDGISQVATARARIGASQTVVANAEEIARISMDAATEEVSRLADADVIESISRMQLSERALEVAMSVTARTFQLTLVDWLR